MSDSKNALDLISNINALDGKHLSPDFNYTYVEGRMPGTYTVMKRSADDPLCSFPILELGCMIAIKYLPPDQLVKQICELLNNAEHKFLKEQNKKKDETK